MSGRVDGILKQFNINFSHWPSCKIIINKLCNFNDNREPPNQAGVVYKTSWNDSNAVCIEETGRVFN